MTAGHRTVGHRGRHTYCALTVVLVMLVQAVAVQLVFAAEA